MTLRRAVLRCAFLCAAACTSTGCSLFKPVDPEPPQGDVLVGNYVDIDSTLSSMARAVRSKGAPGGPDTYRGALADPTADNGRTFEAIFDPLTIARYESVSGQSAPLPWGRLAEVSFYATFVSQNGQLAYDMEWKPYPEGGSEDILPDSARVYRTYRVFLKLADGRVDTLGFGHATLRLIRSRSRWVMVQWIDLEDPTAPVSALSYGGLRFKYP